MHHPRTTTGWLTKCKRLVKRVLFCISSSENLYSTDWDSYSEPSVCWEEFDDSEIEDDDLDFCDLDGEQL